MTPTERWPTILLLLQDDGWQRAADLAEALGVSMRTIYRDMQALGAAGVPLQAVPGQGYRLPEDFLCTPLTLTVDEAVVLLVGSAQAAQHLTGRYRAAARTAHTKLTKHLAPPARERAAALQQDLRLVPAETFGPRAEVDRTQAAVRRALSEHRRLQFELAPPKGASSASSSHTVNPYGLVRQHGAWHLVGLDHDARRVRHFPLRRMSALTVLEETFEPPSGYRTAFDAPVLADETVRVLFDAPAAATVQAPPSLTVTETERRPDGRLLMTLRVPALSDVLPWLRSWGPAAHVLAPDALRQRLAHEARTVARQYRDAPRLIE